MNIPNQPMKSMLTQDNSKIKQEVNELFRRGDLRWNTGATVQEKNDGISLLLQGLKALKIWQSRESDPGFSQTLSNQYTNRYKDVQEKMDYLDKYKKGELVVENAPNNPGNGVQVKKGDGNKDKDDENSKLKGQLSDAIVTEKPKVKWTDIAGLVQAKASLQEAVIIPIRFPQIFEGARQPWKGILMYGPPGTGKTFLAKACATEADGTFFSVSSSDLISKFVGESEKVYQRLIKTLFNMAREKKPSIIFIDEIDSMCGARGEGQNEATRRVITEFLVQMQGVGHDDKGLLVLGATNLPWALDSAIRRRFEKRIYIPLPDEAARTYMLKNALKGNAHSLTDANIEDLAARTDGYSGSDISVFVRDAVYEPVRKLQTAKKFKEMIVDGQKRLTPVFDNETGPNIKEMVFLEIEPNQLYIPPVSYVINQYNTPQKPDFISSLAKAKTSVSRDQLKEYEDWTKQFGQEG